MGKKHFTEEQIAFALRQAGWLRGPQVYSLT